MCAEFVCYSASAVVYFMICIVNIFTFNIAVVNKLIKEIVPNIRVSNDARDLLLNCCTGINVYIHPYQDLSINAL